MDAIRTATDVSLEEKRSFFRGVNKNYGSSALCLSGGASFGYYQYVAFSTLEWYPIMSYRTLKAQGHIADQQLRGS